MDGTLNEVGNTGSLPSAPPPPPEVKVRTMHSDIESMAKSGGGMPRYQNVQISGLSIEKAQGSARTGAKKKSALTTAIAVLISLAIVIGGIYFAYLKFFG